MYRKFSILFTTLLFARYLFAGDTISIIGVGDIMLGTNYPSRNYLPPGNNCSEQLNDVCNILSDADITFGNFEGTMAGNKGVAKKCNDTTKCFVFRMPKKYADCLKECGFDLLSTANNHSNDFGYSGRIETKRILDSIGFCNAGYLDNPYAIFKTNEYKIGFCAFSPHTGTSDSKDYTLVKNTIGYLDTLCDFVIVSIHTGAEGSKHQHLPKTDEEYLGFNRGNIYEFSHLAVDAGADIIFGHGPHVTRAVELYKNRFIAYSLGNFSTYRRFNLSGPNGFAPVIKLEVNENGEFIHGFITPVYQAGEGITLIDPQKRAVYKIIELTQADFPNSIVTIDTEGNIIKKQ